METLDSVVNFEDLFDFSPEPADAAGSVDPADYPDCLRATPVPSPLISLRVPPAAAAAALFRATEPVATTGGRLAQGPGSVPDRQLQQQEQQLTVQQRKRLTAGDSAPATGVLSASVPAVASLWGGSVSGSSTTASSSLGRVNAGSFDQFFENFQDELDYPQPPLLSADQSSSSAPEVVKSKRGRKPGQKSAKSDMKSKLERSRQSARECRARKKLRYQYLDDLILEREKANMLLRQELQLYLKWCHEMDSGHMPEGVLELIKQNKAAGGSSVPGSSGAGNSRPK